MPVSRWKPEHLGLFYGLLGSMLFACKGILIKLAYRHGVSTETFLGLRMMWAAPFFAWVAWRSDGAALRQRWRKQALAGTTGHSDDAMPRTDSVWRSGDVWRVAGLGFSGYYLASYLDFLGLQYVSAGLERVLLYLGPTFVLLLSVFWLKRPVSRTQWTALGVSYLGVILVYLHDLDGSRQVNVPLGSALVLGSCLSYSFYLVGAGEMVRRLGPMRLTAWASLVACVLCVTQALLVGGADLFRQPTEVQGIALMTAIFCTVFPLFLTTASVNHLGAGKAAQVGMIGPVWTIFLGAVVLGEPTGGLQIVGTAVVILGVLILSRAATRG